MPKKKSREGQVEEEAKEQAELPSYFQDATEWSLDYSAQVFYTRHQWKGDIYSLLCDKCTLFVPEEREDDMILHVLTHYPELDREKIMEMLIKRKAERK